MGVLAVLLALLPAVVRVTAETSTPNTGDQDPSFLFAFASDVIVLPDVDSCPTRIPIAPATPIGLGSVDAIAPFVMTFFVNEQLMDINGSTTAHVYAHTVLMSQMSVPQTIANPLMNTTQFIACMWGSGGKSGGCHDLFTVQPAANYADAYANNSSVCRTPDVLGSWITPPGKTLAVDVQGLNGPVVDPRSWPTSCSDLSFRAKNGTPPYTLVIAPAYHPPVNITGNGTSALNYTIRLTHGQAFMTGMFDSAGNSWAMGPFHAGTSQNVSCLATLTGQRLVGGSVGSADSGSVPGVSTAALGGGIGGAFVAGAVLAGLAVFFFGRKKRSGTARNGSTESLDAYTEPRPSTWRHNTQASIAKVGSVSPYTDINSPRTTMNPDSPPALSYSPHSPQRTSSPHSPTRDALQHLNDSANTDGQDRAYRNVMGLGDFHPQLPGGNAYGAGSSTGAMSDTGTGPSGSSYNLASASGTGGSGAGPSSPRKSVYVVHSDGGNNVHIQLPAGGADVVELPPNYQPGIHSVSEQGTPVNEKPGRT